MFSSCQISVKYEPFIFHTYDSSLYIGVIAPLLSPYHQPPFSYNCIHALGHRLCSQNGMFDFTGATVPILLEKVKISAKLKSPVDEESCMIWKPKSLGSSANTIYQ